MPRSEFVPSHVQVRGSGGDVYLVTVTGVQPLACSCPDFVHRSGPQGRWCKHMRVRAGRAALGVTRCWSCGALLTIAELDEQERPENFSRHADPRFCYGCGQFPRSMTIVSR